MILHRALDPATKATVRPERVHSRFDASWPATERLLQKEADHLTGRRGSTIYIEVDLPTSAIRVDGGIRANARTPDTPVVAVAIDGTRHGDLRMVSARYTGNGYRGLAGWQANVRAVALTLEALRSVDRWGAATGQQYQGFAALGSGLAMGPGLTESEAVTILKDAAGVPAGDPMRRLSASDVARLYRAGARRLHPDTGGDPEAFKRLTEARDLLAGGTA